MTSIALSPQAGPSRTSPPGRRGKLAITIPLLEIHAPAPVVPIMQTPFPSTSISQCCPSHPLPILPRLASAVAKDLSQFLPLPHIITVSASNGDADDDNNKTSAA
jgi:hypothetical protein